MEPDKSKKYVYINQLLFLLPTIQDRETVSKSSPPGEEEENSRNEEEFTEEAIHEVDRSQGTSIR
jgi:hypothetical protein